MATANAKPSQSKTGPTANVRPNRLPAPTLFVGPPSQNASQLSLSRQVAEGGGLKPIRDGLSRQKSNLLVRSHEQNAALAGLKPAQDARDPMRRPSEKSVEAKWRQMQSTLNEVELTAQSSTHVFGEKHSAALEELRRSQVQLARAWGRGNEEQSEGTTSAEQTSPKKQSTAVPGETQARKRGDTATSASTQLSGESEASDFTTQSGRSNIEDETAEDIRLATERRAANEAYFKKVDENVKEVVAKLEAVAEAMRGVEGESKSLWSGSSTASDLQAHESTPNETPLS